MSKMEQSRSFPQQSFTIFYPLLQSRFHMNDCCVYNLASIIPSDSTQGRLRCSQVPQLALQVHTLHVSVPRERLLHERPPRCRVNAHMPLWIALTPLLPGMTQSWAPQAKTRNFIDVPFNGFLGPFSKMEDRLEYCITRYEYYIMKRILNNKQAFHS